jgi:hypothetical protein
LSVISEFRNGGGILQEEICDEGHEIGNSSRNLSSCADLSQSIGEAPNTSNKRRHRPDKAIHPEDGLISDTIQCCYMPRSRAMDLSILQTTFVASIVTFISSRLLFSRQNCRQGDNSKNCSGKLTPVHMASARANSWS